MSDAGEHDEHIVAASSSSSGDSTDVARRGRRLGRRAVLLGAAAGAGLAVELIGADPAHADNGGDLILGEENTASATTLVSTTGGIALQGISSANKQCGVQGVDDSSYGYGVIGLSTNGQGVQGTSTNGVGVFASTGGNGSYGVQAQDLSASGGYGVYATSISGTGIYGSVTGQTSGHCGIEGVDSSTGTGGGAGISGTSTNGTGVIGTSTNAAGVIGTTSGTGGSGVSGVDESTGGGHGIYGSSTNGNGVFAYSKNSYALYVDGNTKITGTLSKGGGSFQIDHPVDPAGKYLYHSFVESPDMKNIYDGTATLDGAGRATVELPDWFEALNRDYRYQLTPIGAPTIVYISQEVTEGRFTIAGGNPGQKVCWMVTGIRQDAWANAHRIPVEVDKPAEDQGRYLHPDLFDGQPIAALAWT